MKRLQYLLLLLFTIWGVVACSYNELPEELSKMASPIETPIVLNVETRAETYDGKALDQNYFVSEADLENYVRYRRSATKQPNLTVKEVKSYGFDSSQTLFYILNYEKGWEVVSADKRVQPTLAYGDEGAFTMDCDNESMKFWMNILASGVLQTRQRTGDSAVATASTASKEESDKADDEEQNVAFWNVISPTQQPNTRDGGHLTPIPGPLEPFEYIYLVDIEVETNLVSYIGELIQTEWDQGSPWNYYCPAKINGAGKVPAGCVAIAGAQALYYYHNFFNMDNSAPQSILPHGTQDNWNVIFGNFSPDAWERMSIFEEDMYVEKLRQSAILISHVGYLIDMDYGDNGSSASTMELPEKVFAPYGLSCNKTYNYDADIIKTNVQNRLPVVIRGSKASVNGGGHAWIVDGLERTYDRITSYYAVFSTPQLPSYIDTLDKDDADYSSVTTTTVMEKFHMNWGWNLYDGHYSMLPSDWDEQNSNCGFETNIRIIHDFTVTQ